MVSTAVGTVETGAVAAASSAVVRAFNRELERVRAEEALVANRRELGALREGRVVMLKQGQ